MPAFVTFLFVAVTSAASTAGRPPVQGDDLDPADAVRVELRPPARAPWVGEHFDLELVLRRDERFFAERAVPLVRRALDVPVLVDADWLGGIEGLFEPVAAPPAAGPTLAVGGDIVRAEPAGTRTVDGRSVSELRVARRYRAVGPGAAELGAPRARYAWATRFGESLLGGREPQDHFETVVAGEPVVLTVRALPAVGRPLDFTGAVGSLALAASAAPRDVTLGEVLELTLTVRGAPSGAALEAPTFDGGAAFRSLGWRTERDARGLRFVWSVEPLIDGALNLPVPRLPWFDPDAGEYRDGALAAIPIVARAAASTGAPPPEPVAAADAAEPPRAPDDPAPEPWTTTLVAVGAVLFVAALALRAARRRPRRASAPVAEPPAVARLRAALPAFERGLADSTADVGRALTTLLAATLDREPAAVVGRDLGDLLVAEGLPREPAAGLAALHEALVGARFGGVAPSAAAARARELVAAALDPAGRRVRDGRRAASTR